jgi:hypothetical protein
MISGLKVSSRRWHDNAQHRREGTGRLVDSYRPSALQNPREMEAIPERDSSVRARERTGYSIRQSSLTEYPPRSLFDRSERVGDPMDRREQEGRDTTLNQYPETMDSSMSQNSTYGSPWSGSRATQRSSRSSFSTAPSSMHGFTNERWGDHGNAPAPDFGRRANTIHHSGLFQGPPPAAQSYADPRAGGRTTAVSRPNARGDRPAALGMPAAAASPPDDDPPDWDQMPNFSDLAGGHERRRAGKTTAASRPAARDRSAAAAASPPDDDPPDWDDKPNFRDVARGHERRRDGKTTAASGPVAWNRPAAAAASPQDGDPPGWDETPNFRDLAGGHERRRYT